MDRLSYFDEFAECRHGLEQIWTRTSSEEPHMHRTAISSLVSLTALLCVTAVFAACSSNIIGGTGPSASGGSTGMMPGAPGAGTVNAAGGGGGVAMVTPGEAPSSSCNGAAVPEAFVSTCSGCHTLAGNANPPYPHLYP